MKWLDWLAEHDVFVICILGTIVAIVGILVIVKT